MIRRQLLAGLAAAGLAGCSGGGEIVGLARGESGRVSEIKEGDAFSLASGLAVRLAGVETPHAEAPFAPEARTFLGRLIGGHDVQLYYGGAHRDRYDRAIAHVRSGPRGVWVQKALLEAGMARVHTWPDNQALAHRLMQAEAKARQGRRGLWAHPAYRVLLPSEAVAGRGFTVMEGRVARVTPGRGATWIDFFEGGTAAMIPARAVPALRGAGLEPNSWTGKVLRVRGWLSGAVLTVDHVAAIEQISSQS